MSVEDFDDLTPDPNILFVLTNTPLNPIDALCELIDNALDSFTAARKRGLRIDQRWVRIEIPTKSQVANGTGVIRVTDNGGGLDREGLKGALRAGFSSKNKYSSLGLFGVGFNIATGKFGQRTVVTTGRMNDAGKLEMTGLSATLDLPELKKKNTWRVPIEVIQNPERGTRVEVSGWWPAGSPNDSFTLELAKVRKDRLLDQLGRRYASILRDPDQHVNMLVNDELVVPFEHCVWDKKRSVKRPKLGTFPAWQRVDKVIRTTRRCVLDGSELDAGQSRCPSCNGDQIVTLDEHVHGWIGIQRFDSQNDYGIDLIRNGRAIRIFEKQAFFYYSSPSGDIVDFKEYPISPPAGYGRIVGEIHLDHVPVDYAKQDFQRNTREWQEAIAYIRGGGLTAQNRKPGERNESPLGKIHDGYYRNSKAGTEYMSMGVWTPTGTEKISRDEERKLYQRFQKREPGYFDDEKWWEKVVNADVRPPEPLAVCFSCGAEQPEGTDECIGCGAVLVGKECVGCKATILRKLDTCPLCGASQRVVIVGPWDCEACRWQNSPDDEHCGQCGLERGAPDPMSLQSLEAVARRIDDMSFSQATFKRPNGKPTEPVTITTYAVPRDRLKPYLNQPPVPTYVPSGVSMDKIEIFLDRQHVMFSELGVAPEVAISAQVATYLQALSGSAEHGNSTVNYSYLVLATLFGERLSTNRATVTREVESLLEEIVRAVAGQPWAEELQQNMTSDDRERLVTRLSETGQTAELDKLLANGGFLIYAPRTLVRCYRENHAMWTATVFEDEVTKLEQFAPAVARKLADLHKNAILRALEECADFLDAPVSDDDVLRRVKSSVAYISARLV